MVAQASLKQAQLSLRAVGNVSHAHVRPCMNAKVQQICPSHRPCNLAGTRTFQSRQLGSSAIVAAGSNGASSADGLKIDLRGTGYQQSGLALYMQTLIILHTCYTTYDDFERYFMNVYPGAFDFVDTVASPARLKSARCKKAFIAGVADDQGFGWAIAKALAEAGAEISLGVWVPALNIFESSLRRGKFDESRKLSNGSLLEFSHIFPMDAVFDTPEEVPEEIAANKRYAAAGERGFTVSDAARNVKEAVGNIDVLVHSLANGPEVAKPLLETSRKGYLAAMSASSYSLISMLQRFGPIMNPGGAAISLTYIASEKIIPGYGGGMSSAKAALESDTKVLSFEAGRKYGVRVNTISAGPLGSRAAKAIGFIDDMIRYSHSNAPIQKELEAKEVGNVAAFLLSPLASAVTGSVVYVDNGLHSMGLALDSSSLVTEDDKVPA